MAYPGLPNFGYGLRLTPQDAGIILGKLGLKNPYSEMADAEFEQVQAQTGAVTRNADTAAKVQDSTARYQQGQLGVAERGATTAEASQSQLADYYKNQNLQGAAQLLSYPPYYDATTGQYSPIAQQIAQMAGIDLNTLQQNAGRQNGIAGLGDAVNTQLGAKADADKNRTNDAGGFLSSLLYGISDMFKGGQQGPQAPTQGPPTAQGVPPTTIPTQAPDFATSVQNKISTGGPDAVQAILDALLPRWDDPSSPYFNQGNRRLQPDRLKDTKLGTMPYTPGRTR